MSALDVREQRRWSRERRYRLIGLGFLGIPLVIVTAFAVGEGFGGEAGWWGHLIQLALGLGLTATAWSAPRVGGPLLIGAGLVFSGMMLGVDQEWVAKLSAIAILVVPLLVSGAFFWLAGREPPDSIDI